MNESQLITISALAELERVGIDFDFVNENEIKVRCPFHDDKTPSCSVNIKKNLFACHTAGCKAKGDIISFLAKVLKTTRRVVWEDLSSRYDFEEVKTISSEVIEKWHAAIWSVKKMLNELHSRGVTDKDIRYYRLGYDGSRITIPITNTNGLVVNVRRYLPGAPGAEKMRNKKGHGKIRLFPVDQLKFDKVIVCGGEIKAIVTASKMNKHGFGAVTSTGGEGNWDISFNQHFKSKKVYVCFDVDDEGIAASDKVCAMLKASANWIGNVELSLDKDKYPKGDVNDYFGPEKKTAKDLLKLLSQVEEWNLKTVFEVEEKSTVIDLHLTDASKAEYTGKRVKIKSTVSALDTAPYVIPKIIRAMCHRDQDVCSLCPIFVKTPDENGIVLLELHPESPAILEMVATNKKVQRDAIMSGLHLPNCKTVEFSPTEYYNVEDARLSPQLEISSRSADDIMQPALCIGHGLETNENYEFIGRMYPHPKTQQSVLLISESTATKDALSQFSPLNGELKSLRVFQPKDWTYQALDEKLAELYSDLSANITHIFERTDMHLAIDLAYHSVLLFNFDGKLTKGWVEILIAGDSAQGKTETILRLMQHYGLGERIECKNASVAGLLGGLQQVGGRWFVTWGVIPTHDKRLVVLEEIKGTSTEVLGKLTDMRSSGVAEIPKIEKRRTHARTRLIMISNPRGDRPLSMYNFGIEAVKELIGGLEDIRRFDLISLVSSRQISADKLNKLQCYRPKIKHIHAASLCKSLVLWAWTRAADQVIISDAAHSIIVDEAIRLCNMFSEVIPIVDRGSMRFKLARLSIALACRTFSTDDGINLLVKPCHVEYVSRFLEKEYSSKIFGYKDFSDAIKINDTLLSPDVLSRKILQTPFPKDFIQQLLYTNEIELRDICDWCGWDKTNGLQLLSLLVRKHALTRDGRGYRKTTKFIEFLKELMSSDELKSAARPDYVVEDEF